MSTGSDGDVVACGDTTRWQVLGSAFEVRLSFHNKGDATAFDVSFNDAHAWPKDQFEVSPAPL